MQEEHEVFLVGIIVILIGIYCILAAIFNWNWFFNNSRARGISKMLKRTGARIFYAVLGILFAGFGIAVLILK